MLSYAPRRLKVAPHFKRLHPRPAVTSSLRLQGDWLEAAGFAPGTVALVHVEAGRLIITPAS
ncbi:SymE family type I addiction module toxin [Hymenobacter latericus]|uniref:SymE family type I addiction module toxin n=1 Tax=Hymenobacter sp. YIM 151858-1 TaxID=2987688 RepID=UPI0022260FE5|nr:type I toxin-antitoxin system SymE family toxin [Hymenobacter sp. YIM 151858-1]UYZ60199.1 type I toxin-antitoxin system SymE family toxin [Hymenobacter sp. YIM 151858-1]